NGRDAAFRGGGLNRAEREAVLDAPLYRTVVGLTVMQSSYCFNWRPQGDSNPCYRRERAMSWASRRWGRGGASPAGRARLHGPRTADNESAVSLAEGPAAVRVGRGAQCSDVQNL